MTIEILHIYGQGGPHGEAVICGTLPALTRLRDALSEVIKGQEVTLTMNLNNAEGYDLALFPVTHEESGTLAIPYDTEDVKRRRKE